MAIDSSIYRLEDLLSSFYRIEKVEKVNYHQYVPKKQDDQWSIQMELLIRKQNPRNLVALLSRELWLFSINDEEVPLLPKANGTSNVVTPDKSGHFTADYSKPNLPPHYALFLKALRRMIYINITARSQNRLVPYGNACISLEDSRPNEVLQIEPHLFENGDLAVTMCLKPLGLLPLSVDKIEEPFLRRHALYLAPSGIRMYLHSNNKQLCLVPPPKNAEILLMTLFVSHGINLCFRKDIQWVKVIPHLGHLNGHTPNIAGYMDPPTDVRTIVWPLNLCFAQAASDAVDTSEKDNSCNDLNDAFEIIDDFIQLRQTSAYRTPNSSGGAMGNNAGTNPLSSGGGYTDQFQHYYKNTTGSAPSTSYASMNEHMIPKISPRDISPAYSTLDKPLTGLSEHFGSGIFLTTPNINEQDFSDRRTLMNDLEFSPLKSDVSSNIKNNAKEMNGNSLNAVTEHVLNNDNSGVNSNDSVEDNGLFGDEDDEDDEDLFGEDNDSFGSGSKSKSLTPEKSKSDEITEDMFGMSDDDESSMRIDSNSNIFHPNESTSSLRDVLPKGSRVKRKYLDIPMDEMTLSNSPLYMDPGAPLPIETPRDRRKSVFAPLTFNPIIENNVDNKYKNGGKFSFSPSLHEEPLKFDISTADVSSSEDDSDSSDDFADLAPGEEQVSTETNIQEPQFSNYSSMQAVPDSISSGINKSDLLSGNISGVSENVRDSSNSIWKIPQSDLPQNEPLIDSTEDAIQAHGNLIKINPINPEEDPIERRGIVGNGIATSDFSESEASTTDTIPTDNSLIPETSSSLPFLLRHMPLSSIPSIFQCSNPAITIEKNDQSILELLAEQIVFDYNMFDNLGKVEVLNSGLKNCGRGLVSNIMNQIFTEFTRLHGGDLVNKFYPITQPSVYVKKHHETINLNADSQTFSKYLNTKPAKGLKNFRFLLLTSSFREDCSSFVSTLSQTYIGYEFGFCELLKLANEDTQGLVCLKDLDKGKLLLLAAQIVTYCSTNKNAGNDVPVMIMLPINSNTLEDVVAKVTIFGVIRNEVTSKIPNAQIFLKLVLMNFIRSPLTAVDAYSNLCMGIYNILPPKSVKFTSIAHKLPERVLFRTQQQNNGSTAIHYDALIHLAYARSVDKAWVFAAFSDSRGNENMVKTWYVGTSKSKFDEACNEIWSLALQLSFKKYGKICLILTRLNGVLPDDELMNWRRLSGRNLHLAVVCVDDNTKVSFFDEERIYPTFKPLLHDETLSKEVSFSNLDDYEIRDIHGDIHALLFRHPFPLTNSQHRCAIKSGALVKFENCSGNATLKKFEVNLLNCPHSDSTKLLATILEDFRNLGSLSSWFGVSNGESAHIPWHVLAVKKMMRTLVHTKVKMSE